MSEDIWKKTNTIKMASGSSAIDNFFSTYAADAPSDLRRVMHPAQELSVGTRVAMSSSSLEAAFSYTRGPTPGMEGTVVMVRTSSGDKTAEGNLVFVKWDSGRFYPVSLHHLVPAPRNQKKAFDFVRPTAGAADLDNFFRISADSTDLVHKATKDLWSLQTSKKGEVFLARLFDEVGDPLKV